VIVQIPCAFPLAGIDAAAVPVSTPIEAVPEIWTEHPVATTLDVPEFVRTTVQTSLAAGLLQDVTWALTCAELVNDPNRPKTNPAIAIAAIRVMAMRMTVAKTGEMAFLFFL